MLKVKQLITKDYDEGSGIVGDCYRTCIASLLNINNPECVPHFVKLFKKHHTQASKWMLEYYGQFLFPMTPYHSTDEPKESDITWRLNPPYYPVDKYYIVSGHSKRGVIHACVGWNGEIIHDPHPSSTNLNTIITYEILMYPGEKFRIYYKDKDEVVEHGTAECPYEYFGVDKTGLI